MQNIPAIHNQQIYLALQAAARVIEKMDSDLTAMGKGRDLSKVPAFYGVNFTEFIKGLSSEIPLDSAEKAKWQSFLDENIK